MITTAGAMVSNTLANALLSAGTTSLPCSAACGAIVGEAAAGCGTSGDAAKSDVVAVATSTRVMREARIGSNLDSVQLAMFNSARLPRIHGVRDALCSASIDSTLAAFSVFLSSKMGISAAKGNGKEFVSHAPGYWPEEIGRASCRERV